ncbi:MAG: DNA-processing protein DprA [Arcobacteraceae bacterium]|nr:DNA-processing protein DprA [Arcobacteraceae bacterium]
MIKPVSFHIQALDAMQHYPKELYYKGNEILLHRKKVSIVGTRHPFYSTKVLTQQLAYGLSKAGICVVSGGALGVDAIAHASAGADNTIMVSPTGLDIIYPATNRLLIRNIQENGLVLSMFEHNFKATPWSFVARNELVVALSEILIVTQADKNSGSLRSVEFALNMGKKVYVFPHRIGESEGTNMLLKNHLAEAIYDINEFIDALVPKQKKESVIDDFLEYCKQHPLYDEAVSKYSSKVFEYELEGKIEIKQGRVIPVLHGN